MAGIAKALKRVSEGKNVGKVLAIGFLNNPNVFNPTIIKDCTTDGKKVPDTPLTKYAIIQLSDGGCITEYDYGSDIRINNKLKEDNDCILEIVDNHAAEWRIKASSTGHTLPSRFQCGDNVIINFFEAGIVEDCIVHAVRLTEGKVYYDIKVTVDLDSQILLKDIDSAFVGPAPTRPVLSNRKILVESDGTSVGTHVTIDGKAMGYLNYFKFVADAKKVQTYVTYKSGEEIK